MRLKTLQRYVLRELLWVFALAFVIITAVVCFALIVTTVMHYSPDVGTLAAIVPRLACSGMFIVLPFALLITVSLVYGRLSRDNEVLALEATGTSVYFFVGPGLVLCLFVILANIAFNDYISPRAEADTKALIQQNLSGLLQRWLPTRTEFDKFAPFFLSYERYDHPSHELVKAKIRVYNGKDLVADIHADRAKVEVIGDGSQLRLRTLNPRGVILGRGEPPTLTNIYAADGSWQMYDFDLAGAMKLEKRPKMMTRTELIDAREALLAQLPAQEWALKKAPQMFEREDRLWRLRLEEARRRHDQLQVDAIQDHLAALSATSVKFQNKVKTDIKQDRVQIRKLETSGAKRYAFAFSGLLYVLVGIPLSIAMRRAHMLAAFGIACIFVFMVFWPLVMISTNLGEAGVMPAWAAMSIPFVALGIPGVILNLKLLHR